MESLFIVNPRRKKTRKGRMPAGLRRYWASRRRGAAPKRRRKRRAVMANPRRRRRNPLRGRRVGGGKYKYSRHYRKALKHRKRRANPRYVRRARRRHRNPFSTSGLQSMVTPVAYGAVGALATAVLYGYLSPSLPSAMTTGYVPYLVQAAAAVGLGMLIGKFMSRQDGQYATVGALTVVAVSAISPLITSAVPTVPGLSGLGGMGAYQPYRRMGAYSPGLARNKTTRFGRLGFISPAPKLGAYMGRGSTGADLSGSGFNGLT